MGQHTRVEVASHFAPVGTVMAIFAETVAGSLRQSADECDKSGFHADAGWALRLFAAGLMAGRQALLDDMA